MKDKRSYSLHLQTPFSKDKLLKKFVSIFLSCKGVRCLIGLNRGEKNNSFLFCVFVVEQRVRVCSFALFVFESGTRKRAGVSGEFGRHQSLS